MSEVSTTSELRAAIEESPNFSGRKLIKLAPNTTFEVEDTIWIRRGIILDGQGSVINFKGEGICFKIGEDYGVEDPERPPVKYDSTLSVIKDLDLNGDSTLWNPNLDRGSDVGLLCWSNGLRLNNVRFLHWKTGVECSGSATRNSNNTSFRDLYFAQCTTAIKYRGPEVNEGILDGCQIRTCANGIELIEILHMLFSGVYTDGDDKMKPIVNNVNNADYSTWIGCSPDGAVVTKDFRGGGVIVGGALVSAARNMKLSGDRIGNGESQLIFKRSNHDDRSKGVEVHIPGEYNIQGKLVQSPMKFIQIENYEPSDDLRYQYHGIIYDPKEEKYYIGTQRFIPVPPYDPTPKIGAKWDVK
ncbi:hypothetical protein [Aquimarina megaterium]|uniref:hypothetical protein n=1 Tax=Aquimarina megaterium TaxID=1443666 RepID=UPI000943CB6C|nr:hypothetical protein [Aquimarina megaterium]